jgi:hypothetical protein
MRMIEGVNVSHTQMLPSRLRANPFGRPVVAIARLPLPAAETWVTRPRCNARSVAKITRFLAHGYELV